MYPSKVTNLIIIEWGTVCLTFLLNYHHRLLMGFSKSYCYEHEYYRNEISLLKPVITVPKQN